MWCLALGGQKRVAVSNKPVLEGGQWPLILQLLSLLVWIQISLRFNSWLVLRNLDLTAVSAKIKLVTAVSVCGWRLCVL